MLVVFNAVLPYTEVDDGVEEVVDEDEVGECVGEEDCIDEDGGFEEEECSEELVFTEEV